MFIVLDKVDDVHEKDLVVYNHRFIILKVKGFDVTKRRYTKMRFCFMLLQLPVASFQKMSQAESKV